MIGTLPRPGNGPAVAVTEEVDIDAFWDTAIEANIKTLQRLRDDEFAEELHAACASDAELGRMTPPTVVTAAQCQECILSPRFGVLQGTCRAILEPPAPMPHVFQEQRPMGRQRSGRSTI